MSFFLEGRVPDELHVGLIGQRLNAVWWLQVAHLVAFACRARLLAFLCRYGMAAPGGRYQKVPSLA